MAIALNVSILIVIPQNRITKNPISKLNGIDMAMINEARKTIRKRKTMRIAKTPPTMVSRVKSVTLSSMNADWSKTGSNSTSFSCPSDAAILSASATTALATSTVLASASFMTIMVKLGLPLVRLTAVLGGGPMVTPATSARITESVPIDTLLSASSEAYS